MSDPLRDDPRASGEGDHPLSRIAKIEELLLLGLDHYFSAQYEQAINVWTRVLFLDRNHARSRAYIERARSALAERQREGEELLHSGVAAFQRGDVQTARDLLTSAVDSSGSSDVALALLQRLDRLPPSTPAGDTASASSERIARPSEPATPEQNASTLLTPLRVVMLLVAAASVVLTALVSLDALPSFSFAGQGAIPSSIPPQRAAERVVVPAPGELALTRARDLFDRGHLHESLETLDEIQIGDALKPEADLLRAAVQRALLAGVPAPGAGDGRLSDQAVR
jgi:hypothetical protein